MVHVLNFQSPTPHHRYNASVKAFQQQQDFMYTLIYGFGL
jgi:hypothetical protein